MRTKPELQPFDLDPEEYDVIIIGMPVWAFTMTPAVRSFLNKVKLKDKKIGLFSCHR
jgi:multimeric flavodoxin WrbA